VERSAGLTAGNGNGNGKKEGKQQQTHGANGGSTGSSSGSSSTAPACDINGSPRPGLSPGRLQALRADPMEEQPGLTRLVGREHPIVLGCGVQLFGFEQPAAAASVQAPQEGRGPRGGDGIPEARSSSDLRGTVATIPVADSNSTNVRWGPAYGHAAACGQLALCDPSNGVVLVVTGNKAGIPGQKNVGFEVLKLVAEELHLGKPLPIW
jgi:CubicO group peptidase (beta-lactamase class C family)